MYNSSDVYSELYTYNDNELSIKFVPDDHSLGEWEITINASKFICSFLNNDFFQLYYDPYSINKEKTFAENQNLSLKRLLLIRKQYINNLIREQINSKIIPLIDFVYNNKTESMQSLNFKERFYIYCVAFDNPIQITNLYYNFSYCIKYKEEKKHYVNIGGRKINQTLPCLFHPEEKLLQNLLLNKNQSTFLDEYSKSISQMINEKKIKIVNSKLYYFNCFTDLFNFILSFCIDNNIAINKCKNCNKYFSPKFKSDTNYCNRTSPQDKNRTCREYATYINRLEKLKTDKITKLHKQVYNIKRNNMIIWNNKTATNEFESFKQENNIWRKKVKNNVFSQEDYYNWLLSLK